MQIEFLKKYEGRRVRLILKNNFVYVNVIFSITKDGLIEFESKFGEFLTLEPSFISGITELNKKQRDKDEF